jgi:endonuclease/exonuclease/phosphatase family metal-dependent hydrolase
MRSTRSLLLSAVLLAAAGCGDDDDVTPIPYQDDGKLTVMTRNLYLGADLTAVIEATTPLEAAAAASAVWSSVQANDFRVRANAIADEILAELPDVVGLQEVSWWRTQTPSDFATNPTTNAATNAYDYLDLLLDALAARGLTYVAAQQLDLFDVELPVGNMDVRLTDRQVILVRQGVVHTANPSDKAVFPDAALLPLDLLTGTVRVKRGWTKVEVTVGSGAAAEDATVYNTHLEAFFDPIRDAQAGVLAGIIGADDASRVVLVGDLNSTDAETAYGAFTGTGFSDVWAELGTGDGFTCCFAGDLREPRTVDDLDERIDHVLFRGTVTPETVDVLGEADGDRRSNLWPSDHAGVAATLALTSPL